MPINARVKVTCKECGKVFETPPSRIKSGRGKHCSRECYYTSLHAKHPLGVVDGFKVYKGNNGYARIALSRGRGNEKYLHVYIVEKYLGRFLEKGECVHHINGNPLDNRPENLEVLTAKQHTAKHLENKLILLGGLPGRDKFCGVCLKILPLDAFYPNRWLPSGLDYKCKECSKERARQNWKKKQARIKAAEEAVNA